MPLFDFRCAAGHVTEALAHSSCDSISCEECGELAHKVLLRPPKIGWLQMGYQRDASPEAISRFDKMHRKQKAKDEKCYAEHGDYGPVPGS